MRAKLLESIGTVYCRLGVYDRGLELLRGSLDVRRARLATEHPDVAQSETELAVCLQEVGKLDESEALLRHALEIRERGAEGAPDPRGCGLAQQVGQRALLAR